MTKLYPNTDLRALEPHFSIHMEAMTVEGLHLKSDIAEQLALRDKRILSLEMKLRFIMGCFGAANLLVREHLSEKLDLEEQCERAICEINEARKLADAGL